MLCMRRRIGRRSRDSWVRKGSNVGESDVEMRIRNRTRMQIERGEREMLGRESGYV